jgi:hypothetical protein
MPGWHSPPPPGSPFRRSFASTRPHSPPFALSLYQDFSLFRVSILLVRRSFGGWIMSIWNWQSWVLSSTPRAKKSTGHSSFLPELQTLENRVAPTGGHAVASFGCPVSGQFGSFHGINEFQVRHGDNKIQSHHGDKKVQSHHGDRDHDGNLHQHHHHTGNGNGGAGGTGGQTSTATISGSVLNSQASSPGNPVGLSGVTVTLTSSTGAVVTATSDQNGNFSFAGLKPGTYSLAETPVSPFVATQSTAGTAGGSAGLGQVSGIVVAAGTNATGYLLTESPQVMV